MVGKLSGGVMSKGRFVAYYRVSTSKQGASGLGLEAQQEAVRRFLNGGQWELVGEFTEVETGKGSNALTKRPVLSRAIRSAKRAKARLLIARLDRLARNVHFVSSLMEEKVDFTAVDMPEANTLTVHIMAAMAQYESELISKRTRDALDRARMRGVKLGNPHLRADNEKRKEAAQMFAESLQGILSAFQAQGLSQRGMIVQLNKLGIRTRRGGEWSLIQLQRVLSRLDL